jgi:CubicO group peptidase (beta-lactamase class C family)
MDAALLQQAQEYALTGGGAGLITRGGYVVQAWGPTTERYDVKSSTKSVGVTLLGIAIDDGLVTLDDTGLGHDPEFGTPPDSNVATGWLPSITLRQLATHAAGFDTPGGYVPLVHEPGTTWSYSDGGVNWLADVLTPTFATDLRDVLFQRVLTPLGITSSEFFWRDNDYRDDTIDGIKSRELGAGMWMSVDAMARLGYLYLREGEWDGATLVSASFVQAASVPDPSLAALTIEDPLAFPNATGHYGLLWWNNADGTIPDLPTSAYWSWGLFESLIVVIPDYDVVVARAGPNGWGAGWSGDYAVLVPFLQPIAQSLLAVAVDEPLERSTWAGVKARYR